MIDALSILVPFALAVMAVIGIPLGFWWLFNRLRNRPRYMSKPGKNGLHIHRPRDGGGRAA